MLNIEYPEYGSAQPVLAELAADHIELAGILDGTIDGDVWVDRQDRPQFAVVSSGDTFYVACHVDGDAAQAVRDLIPDWAYVYVQEPWGQRLPQIWSNPFAIPHPRVRFGLPSVAALSVPPALPAGVEIAPIDRALLARPLDNLDVLHESIESWRSEETFFDAAIGFCAVRGGQIVSHCLTDSVVGQRCEVGVSTDPAFRGLGLGRYLAWATVEQCMRRGLQEIEWHCHTSNKGSRAIARSIGLVEQQQYTAYSCRLPAENAGDLEPARCLELAHHFEQAGGHIPWCYFYAAGARALIGDREGALRNIGLLIDGGWEGQAQWLDEFWALQTLQGDASFQALLALQRERQAQQ
ncbi:GNAT family N-acetyltransferase [Alcaligenes sp. SDU_A2]|uniref:GNAT family N-acetyltransferase n=1 Tax=Alcaligenes sp. SDU_A2 TaxID=3136634 RepID=UPI00311FE449